MDSEKIIIVNIEVQITRYSITSNMDNIYKGMFSAWCFQTGGLPTYIPTYPPTHPPTHRPARII